MTTSDDTVGPIDEPVLRSIRDLLDRDQRFDRTAFEPSATRIRNLTARYDRTMFPERIREARLDIRWYVGGDFSIHYIETTEESRWECRWDRNPKPIGRTHFHPPPNADDAVPTDLPEDYRDILAVVTAYVSERIETLWERS